MPRSRVLSFMSQWGNGNSNEGSPVNTGAPPSPTKVLSKPPPQRAQDESSPARTPLNIDTATPQSLAKKLDESAQNSPRSPGTPSRARGDSRVSARPSSMIQTYQPPQVDVANDTPPELAPIFSFLNSHSNKLYQEGYFLKLHDLDSRGRPSADRTWVECFAQLVGTVLSLWDAAALDTAGEDGEVVPTFINLSDASIKMIESLPMSGAQGGSLSNVLSISTAANNRYLLHFNSLSSLTQWTAGIRLAIFEHTTLQEAYTGSLIAGKGRFLNNIRQIMERSKFAHEDWARVRFGSGTPWRRCWCVISPPEEKEYQKAQKTLKKGNAYGKQNLPRGDIKFYDTRKVTKKTKPIATISNAYAAYAIYPQSKPLIDQSTLVKLEGLVTIHSTPEATTEGFTFVMPEVHPAVTGFEMMLRWLFPVYDTFNLYGRPTRLIADTLDQRGLMFAMPRDRRYGYLDILDVSGLIHTSGSQTWTERQWRRELKKLTSTRMMSANSDAVPAGRAMSQRRNTMNSRTSLGPSQGGAVRFEDGASTHSSPGSRTASPVRNDNLFGPPMRVDSAPPGGAGSPHKRAVSDTHGIRKFTLPPSRLSSENYRPSEDELPPPPPRHGGSMGRPAGPGYLPRIQSEAEVPTISSTFADLHTQSATPVQMAPIGAPPAFQHQANSRPANQPVVAPELRRAHSNVDNETLYQMQEARRERPPSEGFDMPANAGGDPQYLQQQQLPYRGLATDTANRHLNAPADRSQVPLSNRMQRDPRQRLSTIPGSPYVGAGSDYFQSPDAIANPMATQLGMAPGAAPATSRNDTISPTSVYSRAGGSEPTSAVERPGPPVPMHSSGSITRKPVPKKLPETPPVPPLHDDSTPPPADPSSPISSHDSLRGALVDQAALEAILNQSPDQRANTMQSEQSFATSTAPSYSSEPEIVRPKEPAERARFGKLKTVGVPDMPQGDPRSGRLDPARDATANAGQELPIVDFGPTFAYRPTSRPATSGTVTLDNFGKDRSRSRSTDRLRESSRDRLMGATASKPSPGESNRHSYFGGRTTPTPGGLTPGGETGDRPSVAWQPSASPSGSPNAPTGLTPEQWVQYRANIASHRQSVPVFAHNRQESSSSVNQLRKTTKTPPLSKTPPPLSRTPSGDWTQQGRQTPPNRPNSRGAGQYLTQPATSPGPSALSAKEQMHVARATGTPLISMAGSPGATPQGEGLIGGIAQREREKAALRKGVSGNAVQQAIVARQQQQMQVEAEQRAAQQFQLRQQQQQAFQMQQQAAYQQQIMYQQHQAAQAQAQPQTWNAQAPMQPQQQQMYAAQPGFQQQQGYPQQGYLPQQQQQQPFGGYGQPSPQSPGAFTGQFAQRGYESQQQQHPQMMMMPQQQQTQSPRQAYGASYFAQQQQQQQGRR